MILVIQISSTGLLSRANATPKRGREPLIVITPHHGIAKIVEIAATHCAPTISVSHPVNRDAG